MMRSSLRGELVSSRALGAVSWKSAPFVATVVSVLLADRITTADVTSTPALTRELLSVATAAAASLGQTPLLEKMERAGVDIQRADYTVLFLQHLPFHDFTSNPFSHPYSILLLTTGCDAVAPRCARWSRYIVSVLSVRNIPCTPTLFDKVATVIFLLESTRCLRHDAGVAPARSNTDVNDCNLDLNAEDMLGRTALHVAALQVSAFFFVAPSSIIHICSSSVLANSVRKPYLTRIAMCPPPSCTFFVPI
jgi:hypothetical protein